MGRKELTAKDIDNTFAILQKYRDTDDTAPLPYDAQPPEEPVGSFAAGIHDRNTTIAGSILREAANAVDGDRNNTHGDKERSFEAIAADWTTYLATRKEPHGPVRSHDVAHMMVRMKQQRAEWGSPVRDQFMDAAGYSAIAGELVK